MRIRTEGNTISLYGDIYRSDAPNFLAEFAKLDGVYDTVHVRIHSGGGSVFAGNMILNALAGSKSRIHMLVVGIAASMGCYIMLAGDRVDMVENGFCMTHKASGWTDGDSDMHESNANLLREMDKSFIRKLMTRTGKSKEEVEKWLVGDNWFSAEQALAVGLIDGIVDPMGSLSVENPEAVGKKEMFERFSAHLEDDFGNGEKLDADMDRNFIIARLGMKDVDAKASDTEVLDAVVSRIDRLEKELASEKTAHGVLKDAMAASEDLRIVAVVDKAFSAGLIPLAKKETYVKVGKDSGIETLESLLSTLNPRRRIEINPGSSASSSRAGWDWDKYQNEDPNSLSKMRDENFDEFNILFKAKYGLDYQA